MRRFLLKFAKILLLLLLISYYVYENFIYFDKDNGCFIKILPSFMLSNSNTKEVIKVIKYSSYEDYQRLCKYVRTIDKNPSCGGLDGGCYEDNKPNTIFVGSDQGNLGLAASIIVHEVCHAKQASDNVPISEYECYKEGYDFLTKITDYKTDELIQTNEEL